MNAQYISVVTKTNNMLQESPRGVTSWSVNLDSNTEN